MAEITPDIDAAPPWGEGQALLGEPSESALSIWASANNPSVTIHYDGRVELGEGVTLDDASRQFWDAVQTMGLSTMGRVRALHRKETHGPDCVYCVRGNNGAYDVTWPCDTIRALDGQAS